MILVTCQQLTEGSCRPGRLISRRLLDAVFIHLFTIKGHNKRTIFQYLARFNHCYNDGRHCSDVLHKRVAAYTGIVGTDNKKLYSLIRAACCSTTGEPCRKLGPGSYVISSIFNIQHHIQ